MRDRRDTALAVAAGAAFVGGVLYAALVLPGLMYDEPAHWHNVVFYATHLRLPQDHAPGTTYEAAQPPLAYMVDAVVYRLLHPIGPAVAFYAVRLVGVVEWVGVVVVLGRLLRRLLPGGAGVPVALTLLALNPMLLAMAGAVQNDMLALLLGFGALDLLLSWDRPDVTFRHGLAVGALAALAFLTKETAWPLIVVVPALWIVRFGLRQSGRSLLAFAACYVVLVGWWVGRNLSLYHSVLGRVGFGHVYRVHGLSGLWHVAESLIVYLWLPTEYFRNQVRSQLLVALVVLATLAVVALFALYVWQHRRAIAALPRGVVDGDERASAWSVVGACGFLGVAGWVISFTLLSGVEVRTAYMVWPLWLGMVAAAANVVVELLGGGRRVLAVLTGTFLVVCNLWVLATASGLHHTPYRIHLA